VRGSGSDKMDLNRLLDFLSYSHIVGSEYGCL